MKEYKSLLSLLKEEDAAAKAYNAFMGAYENEVQDMNERLVAFPIVDDAERFIREKMAESAKNYLERAQEARQKLFAAKMAICAYFTTDELEGENNK